jgi:hypothetical protein
MCEGRWAAFVFEDDGTRSSTSADFQPWLQGRIPGAPGDQALHGAFFRQVRPRLRAEVSMGLPGQVLTETSRIHVVLFGTQKRMIGPCLAAIHGILVFGNVFCTLTRSIFPFGGTG